MIPFLDLRSAYLELKPELDAAAIRVMNSGMYILGEEVEAFEQAWARWVAPVTASAAATVSMRSRWRCARWAWKPATR